MLIHYKEGSREGERSREERKIGQTLVGSIEEIEVWWIRDSDVVRKLVKGEGDDNKKLLNENKTNGNHNNKIIDLKKIKM